MSDTTISTADAGNTVEQAPEGAASDNGFTPITSQEELDRIIQPRIARERSKFEGFEDFKAAASRVPDLEARVQTFEAAEARSALVAKVAKDTGVDAAVIADLRGDTEDELAARATQLAERFKPTAPVIPDQDKRPANAPQDEMRTFKNNLFG